MQDYAAQRVDFEAKRDHWRELLADAVLAPTGTVAIWLMNGISVVQTGTLGAVPANWIVSVTGDFSGDLKSDVLWRDTSTGAVAIWRMNGLQITSSLIAGTAGTDWIIQGLNAD